MPFLDETIITHKIELPPPVEEIGFNFMDDNEFTIPYIIDIFTNLLTSRQLLTHDKKNVLAVAVNGEEPIPEKGAHN